MNNALYPAAAFALSLLASPAVAQSGAMWVDPIGRMMSIQFAGTGPAAPGSRDRSTAEMAERFKTLCLDTWGSGSGLAAAAATAGLSDSSHTIPGSKKAAAIKLEVWTGEGLVLSQSPGFFAAQIAQCNATFYVGSLPERQAVIDALAAAIGSPPSNLSSALDKKGRPKKYYSPEWTLSSAGGSRIVTAFVGKGSSGMPGDRVQISVRAAKKPGR